MEIDDRRVKKTLVFVTLGMVWELVPLHAWGAVMNRRNTINGMLGDVGVVFVTVG